MAECARVCHAIGDPRDKRFAGRRSLPISAVREKSGMRGVPLPRDGSPIVLPARDLRRLRLIRPPSPSGGGSRRALGRRAIRASGPGGCPDGGTERGRRSPAPTRGSCPSRFGVAGRPTDCRSALSGVSASCRRGVLKARRRPYDGVDQLDDGARGVERGRGRRRRLRSLPSIGACHWARSATDGAFAKRRGGDIDGCLIDSEGAPADRSRVR